MDKYIKAMDFGKKIVDSFIADGTLGNAEQCHRKYERFFDGIIEVAIYDANLSQEEFAQLQRCSRMTTTEYWDWRKSYGK